MCIPMIVTEKLVGVTGLSFIKNKTHGLCWAATQNNLGMTSSSAEWTMKEASTPVTCYLGRGGTGQSWAGGDCGDVELWKRFGFLTYRQLPSWLLPSRDIHCLLVLDLWDVMLCKGHQGAQFKRVCVKRCCILEPEDAEQFHSSHQTSIPFKTGSCKNWFWWTGS